MKKFIYLCGMMLMTLNMTAQFLDDNWNEIINDDFSDFVGWNQNSFIELSRFQGYQPIWECFMRDSFTGVTSDDRHQAYQTHCAFLNADNKMTLKAQYISNTSLICGVDYSIPFGRQCSDNNHPFPNDIFYYSGTIETKSKYWFGYYEIKCRLPVHQGTKTSFWLFGGGPHSYEEIDIFEHSEDDCSNQLDRGFSCGIHYNPYSTSYSGAHNTVKLFYVSDNSGSDLSEEHTYACEWLPNKITWFFDRKVIFECNDRSEIPQYPMRIKVTHPLTYRALNGDSPGWFGTDNVVIDYIKYYQIEFDCNTDIAIRNTGDIMGYQPGVKHAIAIGTSGGLEIPSGTDISFMASESITINDELTIPVGAKVTMRTLGCPEE
ncbi:MAG: family 16 glycosylhydrolase [Bacteroidales bacterium]|nr:family 16 glycosylhydrolase [Bacteroidales bacterium]